MHDLLTQTNTQTDTDPKLTAFLEEGCGCKRNSGKPCYTSFSWEQYEASRMRCAELSRSELDLVILGQIAALLKKYSQTNTHRQASQRQRTSMVFHRHGVPTCRETFLKLHGIGKMGYNKKRYNINLECYRARPLQKREGQLSCFRPSNQDPWKLQEKAQTCTHN